MVEQREVWIDGRAYAVTVSDEREALLAAMADGGAAVAVLGSRGADSGLWCCPYAVEQKKDADEAFLERVLRRTLGLPWIIARTKRLIIREFAKEDACSAGTGEKGSGDDCVFADQELLSAYIKNQYQVFGWGIWALEERESGRLIGRAGLSESGLGYHIYEPYRGLGYAAEACRAIVEYASRELEMESLAVVTAADNTASVRTALSLGFVPEPGEDAGLVRMILRLKHLPDGAVRE